MATVVVGSRCDAPGNVRGTRMPARRETENIELPLTEVEVGKRNLNRRLLADYYPEKTPGSAGGLAAFDSSVVKQRSPPREPLKAHREGDLKCQFIGA